ncbi:GD14376 [Drosophila simulans]|uniref:GD14376 n=1 Tax=Drosophila simulans TaxID=7240 RepID=B4QRA0_DROSI|nr:GD14376 [Drosophila simulans]
MSSCPEDAPAPIPPALSPFRVVNADVDGRDLACDNYMGPVLCDASLAPDLMAKSGSSLKRGPTSKGRAYELGAEEPGLVIRLPETQGFGHSGAAPRR